MPLLQRILRSDDSATVNGNKQISILARSQQTEPLHRLQGERLEG